MPLAHDPTALCAGVLVLVGLQRPLRHIAGRIALWTWRREFGPVATDARQVIAALQSRRRAGVPDVGGRA